MDDFAARQSSYQGLLVNVLMVSGFFLIQISQANSAMFGLSKKYDVHLCPEVKGQILQEGTPVAGLEVLRGLTYVDNIERLDSTVTDAQGRFLLPEVVIQSKLPGDMFVESRTRQIIIAKRFDIDYLLWGGILHGIEPNEAFSIKLSTLQCDLISPEINFEFYNKLNPKLPFTAQGICRWEQDFTPY
ncbi:DUF6795 domain-containing protein [Thalassomonas haliotis]|uniref:DUF6795 domain-containing protein n=1 Tax=Thalassomonas haliotis TaxID=485448 RepID=A0ABY7VGS8_9GAMM|nr:DUF6795 domain-containing protein [Thalassomonas haliotis]WDE12414.1 hypothetical protein H3N35_02705 [Thalassomonas haliotis]